VRCMVKNAITFAPLVFALGCIGTAVMATTLSAANSKSGEWR
jgi:hypothetical protein